MEGGRVIRLFSILKAPTTRLIKCDKMSWDGDLIGLLRAYSPYQGYGEGGQAIVAGDRHGDGTAPRINPFAHSI